MLARGEISPEVVREFDRASKGKTLPERVKGKKIMAVRRKKAVRRTRRASTHRRRRDPVAAAPLATATSRHRRRPAKRKPAKRRARGFSLRDFLGVAPSKHRRRPAKRKAAKRKTATYTFVPGLASMWGPKGWVDPHKVPLKYRAKAIARAKRIEEHGAREGRDWSGHPRLHAKAARKGHRKAKAKKRTTRRAPARRGR